MSKIEQYIHAATRENTRRSYQSAIRHFEVTWGGFLPATADSVARYLAEHADTLAVSTLRLRLAALAQWHREQGFPDPTKAPVVRKVLKGIRELHPAQEKRARPLQVEELDRITDWLEGAREKAETRNDRKTLLAATRNKAILLLGFWRGFRSDELCRLQVEFVTVSPGEGMTLFLPRSKGDRQSAGREFRVPALSRLCPVAAYEDWIRLAGIGEGPVFRAINRWGQLSGQSLSPNSISPLLRHLFAESDLAADTGISSHSLRRGFANWASSHGWDTKTLMEYVGWRDVQSAMRYIDTPDPFSRQRIEKSLTAYTSNRLTDNSDR
ncbi:site-specific integrase [Microbulbifer thermotolerans]|uniref:Recombinase n=1 Tax=Microbulbifer thermotolerans TaxID=252514 RepID=A0A143HLH1_MICTH|nr:site-specific integrase [Microbulbifer thermotolerans]AMX02564.1 recombinase [Microbulbifer thermotolerans]